MENAEMFGKKRITRALIALTIASFSTLSNAGTFYVVSCEPSYPEDNFYEDGDSYHISMFDTAVGGLGLYNYEIECEDLWGYLGELSYGLWRAPRFTWTIRWVPAFLAEQPPFGINGSAGVVVDHELEVSLSKGTGAGVEANGYALSHNVILQSVFGTLFDETFEFSSPNTGEFLQDGSHINVDPQNLTFTAYFEYDEVADDGSWIGICNGTIDSFWIEAEVETSGQGTAVAFPQIAGSMEILTVSGQSVGSTTGGPSYNSDADAPGGEGGGSGGSPVFPLLVLVMTGLGVFVTTRSRK
jgi:hypothetical protein